MGRRSGASESDEGRRNPRRGGGPKQTYSETMDEDDVDDRDEDEEVDPMEVDEADDSEDMSADDDSDDEPVARRRPRRKASEDRFEKKQAAPATTNARGRPSRSSRFQGSMKEPPSDSVRDLFQGTEVKPTLSGKQAKKGSKKTSVPATKKSKGKALVDTDSEEDRDDDEIMGSSSDEDSAPIRSMTKKKAAAATKKRSMPKSPARRHPVRKSVHDESTSDEDSYRSAGDEDDGYDSDNQPELKIQRILASRSETRATWKKICYKMQTMDVNHGSMWYQGDDADDLDQNVVEERFLVKWSDHSYLHVSWETQADLCDQVKNAKTYLSTFFRKADNGILLSPEDRKDGDYFDPGYTQIERILETVRPGDDDSYHLPATWEEELATSNDTFAIVLDPSDLDKFEAGGGRQFLIKWEGLPYSESTYEFERDLILADLEYKPILKDYYERVRKPSKSEWSQQKKDQERAMREAYKLFGDNAKTDSEAREKEAKKYQENLANHVFSNGGQLRDYQAEGVTWFLSNFVNQRSCILADEMGLGKTLQTAAFVNLLVQKMHRPGPFLVVVPLSTLAHWQREFVNWTGLNTIVYHGSAEDRRTLREYEFAYPQDRPDSVGSNTIYLNKCAPAKRGKGGGGPWMATVVVCTPEMLVADDANELAAVPWEVLVVDEAHRLKNHNSKLATTLRKDMFTFKHKLLLTGTPIQNDMKEFWTLLNFIDPDNFPDMEEFLEEYGAIKSKEKIDEMHETIRPYILRRLKEDVEKSVPPKEETLIEVELTLQQKQYYRALYEKNVAFLQKNKTKALDGPSLNNLAMQLRKCCNHLFLLNGVEEEIRKQKENHGISEADLLARGSGKLVLLDKLLPRLKENGHQILIFSQFKIMLDVLEDYLYAKQLKFERIDGSITGHRRQAAIDRFQDPESKDPPFIMLLSTRAGGVGINLTSADTCIIFDSDWNPQNDLQAQARCHRIGQTKNVKVYRLLSRKSYEMQMFHMSSLKMGLDQAVLKGFETGASGEGAMTKEEVERLLRHGAYDIFNEEKAGSAEAESKDFIEQDIDSILARRATTVVHDNTGSGSNAAGGTFSKASFVAPKTPSGKQGNQEQDIDIEDPDFWKKMVGEAKPEAESVLKPRKRSKANYSEKVYGRELQQMISLNPDDSESSDSGGDESDDSDDEMEDDTQERARWGGPKPEHWRKPQALTVLEAVERFGFGNIAWEEFKKVLLPECEKFEDEEIQRMTWAITLLALCEVAKEDAKSSAKRVERQAARKREEERTGDSLAEIGADDKNKPDIEKLRRSAFSKLWKSNSRWASLALNEAVKYAESHEPRAAESNYDREAEVSKAFYSSLWDSLKGRGWKEEETENGSIFKYDDMKFGSPSAVLNEVIRIHPELANMVVPLLNSIEERRVSADTKENEARSRHLGLQASNVDFDSLLDFLLRYAPLQLFGERRHTKRLPIGRRVLSSCANMHIAALLSMQARNNGVDLKETLSVDGRSTLPHPLWTLDHDAILIQAIAKHGWVDREKACKRIVKDSSIKWGFPFEAVESSKTVKLSDHEAANLRATAERAASFLESGADILEALKGVNRHLIIESYGLKHNSIGDDEGTNKWVVDEDSLNQASTKDDGAKQVEIADLPTKKDLAKRAKLVLQKSLAVLEGGGSNSKPHSQAASAAVAKENPTHGYTVVDQSNRCFILLAEMIRGICRGSLGKAGNQVKLLSSLAFEEAQALKDMYSAQATEAGQQRTAELSSIIKQIQLARQSMKVSAIPAKNLLRVMIGLETVQPKSPTDPIFPSQAYLDRHQKTTVAQPKKEVVRKDEGTLGEKALSRCFKKAYDKSPNGLPKSFALNNEEDDSMQLTMTEGFMLGVFCTLGVPLSHDVKSIDDSAEDGITWDKLRSMLLNSATQVHQESKEKLEILKAKLDSQTNESAKVDISKKVLWTSWEEAMNEEAVRKVESMDTEGFTKKSIMFVEKVRKFAFPTVQTQTKTAHKYENGLGPKVVQWFGKELAQVAGKAGIVDGNGSPIGAATEDLLRSNPELANDAKVGAYLDKKNARLVISQAALLSRLNILWAKMDASVRKDRLADAIARSRKLGDVWEKKPSWWQDTGDANVRDSITLLEALKERGLVDVLAAEVNFGEGDEIKAIKDYGLTKQTIQLRANQLVRELHAIEEKAEIMRMLEERRSKAGHKKNSYDKGLMNCHMSAASKPDSTKKSGGLQTELSSFFKTTKSGPKKSSMLLSVSDENSKPSSAGKRKESPVVSSSEDNSPAEKKPKKLAPLFVAPGKRSESPGSVSEKRMETVVNEDGVIELVAVRK